MYNILSFRDYASLVFAGGIRNFYHSYILYCVLLFFSLTHACVHVEFILLQQSIYIKIKIYVIVIKKIIKKTVKNVRKNNFSWNQESIPRIYAHFSWQGKTQIGTAATRNPVDPDATTRACNKNVNKKCTSTNY